MKFVFTASPSRSIEEAVTRRQSSPGETIPRAIRMKEPASIVVPDKRQRTGRTNQCFEVNRHPLQAIAILLGRLPRQNRVEQKHIQRVNVIVAGLLEMTAVVPNLPLHFLVDNPCSEPLPSLRTGSAPEHHPESMQGDTFPQQMRVRREVYGEVRLQMQSMLIQTFAKPSAPSIAQVSARQVIDPHPGKRPERYFERARPVDPALHRIRLEPAIELAA